MENIKLYDVMVHSLLSSLPTYHQKKKKRHFWVCLCSYRFRVCSEYRKL